VNRRLCAAAALACAGLTGCSDGATRLAYQIEAETAALARSGASRVTLVHQPARRWGNGCAEAYKVQVDQVGALIIWCLDSRTGATTGSHSTSYHGRFVESPQTWIVEKKAGESLYIDLEKGRDKARVVAVR